MGRSLCLFLLIAPARYASILHSLTSSGALFLASFSPSLLRSSRSLTPGKFTPASSWFRSVVFIPNIARSRLFIIRSAQFGSSSLSLYCSLLSPLAIEPSRSVGSRKVRYHHGYHARVFSLSNPSPGGVEEILIQDLPEREKKQGSENGVLRRVTVHRQVKLTYRSAIRENRQTKREHDEKEQE